jgi:hypothetical protein
MYQVSFKIHQALFINNDTCIICKQNNWGAFIMLYSAHGVTVGKSLIYIAKSSGPKIDPCVCMGFLYVVQNSEKQKD